MLTEYRWRCWSSVTKGRRSKVSFDTPPRVPLFLMIQIFFPGIHRFVIKLFGRKYFGCHLRLVLISFPAQSGNELEHEEVPPHSCILSELLSGILMLLISVSVRIRRALRHFVTVLVYVDYSVCMASTVTLYWAFLMSVCMVFMFGREIIVVEIFKVFDDTGRLYLPSRWIWKKKLFSQVNLSVLSE